jgi:hypothetical protein
MRFYSMQNTLHQTIAVSHTKDRSLEAYKAWIMEIARRLTTKETRIELTEEEWIENWKAFLKESSTHQIT